MRPVPILAALCLAAFPLAAQASLNRAYDSYKTISDMADDLKKAADASVDNQDWSALASLADKYASQLDSMKGELNSIGENCKESDNKDAVGKHKDAVISAAAAAIEKAKALKSKADAKTDPSSEIKDLREELATVSDDFRECWKDHDTRHGILDKDYIDAVSKFADGTKDDQKAVADAAQKWRDASSKTKSAQDKFSAANKSRDDAWTAFQSAAAALNKEVAKPDGAENDLLDASDKNTRSFEDWKKADDAVSSAIKDWNSAQNDEKKSLEDYNKADADFRKIFDDKENPLVQAVLKKHKLLYDLNTEYKSMSM